MKKIRQKLSELGHDLSDRWRGVCVKAATAKPSFSMWSWVAGRKASKKDKENMFDSDNWLTI